MKRADFLATLDIGMTVKKLREKKGLSQEQLAKDICDRTNITKLENGHSKVPSLSFVLAICEKLEISIDEFLNFALLDNYKLDRKLILDLLINDDILSLKDYLQRIKADNLTALDVRYYEFLLAKVYLNENKKEAGYKLLKKIVSTKENDYVCVLAIHELIKHNLIKYDSNVHQLYSRGMLSKLKNKNSNDQYLYFINDLLDVAIKENDQDRAMYLLELEISFINSHDLYKYLPKYYQDKIKVLGHKYTNLQDLENNLFPIKNRNVTN